jgi:site-specific DNA recombinase
MSRGDRLKADAQVPVLRKHRCAIYTRVSSDERLIQDFNSLQAQREACEAYIASQRQEGWGVVGSRYDDGGFSGGTMERPGLKRLFADIEAGLIDIVVVYKVDRLSRSIRDFMRFVEICERRGVAFVSVTQHFKTDTSMGRLVLNMLLSFAQFEREVIGERIRDKVAASKRKGIWMGGCPPLGYQVKDRKLVVIPDEANVVRQIFRRFVALGSGTLLVKELAAHGHQTKSWTTQAGKRRTGRPFSKGTLYKLLNNHTYLGEVAHKGRVHAGEHEAIVPRDLWDKVHAILAENYHARGNRTRAKTPALLRGVIRCAAHGCAMAPTFTRKKGRLYRYYLCTHAAKHGYDSCANPSVAAGDIERAVIDQLRSTFRAPRVLARSFRAIREQQQAAIDRLAAEREGLVRQLQNLRTAAARALKADTGGDGALLRQMGDEITDAEERLDTVTTELEALSSMKITEREVMSAFQRIDPIWESLFPAEQERVIRLLVQAVLVGSDGLELHLKADGLAEFATEIGGERAA